MRVALDSCFLLPHPEGFSRFTREVGRRLVQYHPEITFDFLTDHKLDPKFHFGPNQHTHLLFPPNRHWTLYEVWWRFAVPWYVRKYRPSVFFLTYGQTPIDLSRKVPMVAFIHDVGFARHPEFITRGWYSYYMRAVGKAIHTAKLLIANSLSVKQDLLELFGAEESRIRIAYSGCDVDFFHPLSEAEIQAIREQYAEGHPYVLYVGSLHRRKNPLRALQAYERLRSEYFTEPLRFIVVGRFLFGKMREVEDWYHRMRFRAEVSFLSYLSDPQLHKLYGAAAVVFYPSLYEGFGSPVAEGLAVGVPVVTSRVSSLPEVGGEAAFYANPYDVEDIARALYQALTLSPQERHHRAQLGRRHVMQFSWDRCVQEIWNALQEAAGE
ncbi:MAG: glycosyltransferase family 1 protein [Bacteroidia bacterium]|nr:glycosyltransferase family 1 protein [Bacteroidia bacterium]